MTAVASDGEGSGALPASTAACAVAATCAVGIDDAVVGGVIPGSGGRRLEGTVFLDGVEYRYVNAGSTSDPEPRLLQIRERRGHLEVDITGPQIVAVAVPSAPPVPPPPTVTVSVAANMDAGPCHMR